MTTDGDAAPPAMRLVRDFVNTADLQDGQEELDSARSLRDWLVEHQLLTQPHRVTSANLHRAIAIREGLRAVLQAHAGHDVDPAAVARLNRNLESTELRVTFDADGGPRLVARGGHFDAAIAGLIQAIAESVRDDSWLRLKVCAKDSCRWAFYDASRNRSGRWCSMAVCGNQVKMKRAYASRRRVPP